MEGKRVKTYDQSIKKKIVESRGRSQVKKKCFKSNVIKVVTHNTNGYNESSEYDTKELIKTQKPDVVGILETKIRREDGGRDLDIKGYARFEVRRSDEDEDRKGGGIMVFAKETSNVKLGVFEFKIEGESHAHVQKERLWITRKPKTGAKMAFCFVYMAHQTTAPVSDQFGKWNDAIYEVLEKEIKILKKRGYKIHLSGDLNAWVGDGICGIRSNDPRVNRNGERLVGFLSRMKMVHLNGEEVCSGLFTRHCDAASTVLDYVCMEEEDIKMVKSMVIDEFGHFGGHSDHVYMVSNLDIGGEKPLQKPVVKTKSSWAIGEETDWDEYRRVVDEGIQSITGDQMKDVNQLGEAIQEVMIEGLEEVVGQREIKPREKKRFPPRVVKMMEARRKKTGVWRKARSEMSKESTEENRRRLCSAVIEMNLQKEKTQRTLESFWNRKRSRIIESLKTKSVRALKLFWSYVRNKDQKPVSFLQLEDSETGELVGEQQEMKGVVERFMKNLFKGGFEPFKKEDKTNIQEEELVGEEDLEKEFTLEEVNEVVKSLKNGKAKGVDLVPHEAVKNGSDSLKEAVVKLFNLVKKQGKVPELWKEGRVVIIHKKGPVTDLVNYRPLTVLVCLSGLFSKVLNTRLTKVVEEKNILGEIQNGFRKGRSGADNNFVLHTILMKCSAKGMKPNLAFIDIRKVGEIYIFYEKIVKDRKGDASN